jgi:hypothetical protein
MKYTCVVIELALQTTSAPLQALGLHLFDSRIIDAKALCKPRLLLPYVMKAELQDRASGVGRQNAKLLVNAYINSV